MVCTMNSKQLKTKSIKNNLKSTFSQGELLWYQKMKGFNSPFTKKCRNNKVYFRAHWQGKVLRVCYYIFSKKLIK